MSTTIQRTAYVALALCAVVGASCGSYVRDQGTGATQATVATLEAAPGAEPNKFGGTLSSDVVTNVRKNVNGVIQSCRRSSVMSGRVTMSLMLKDPGPPGIAHHTDGRERRHLTHYRVTYTRTDGRNVPRRRRALLIRLRRHVHGDAGETVTAGFEIVRNTAKEEAPLRALVSNPTLIGTIAEVTFYGKDRSGHDVSASGSIGITFGNFGDPD
jgi:hypothetical protein